MLKDLLMKMEVAEVYSPPRATRMAEAVGLRAGWALDLTTYDDDGRPWEPLPKSNLNLNLNVNLETNLNPNRNLKLKIKQTLNLH